MSFRPTQLRDCVVGSDGPYSHLKIGDIGRNVCRIDLTTRAGLAVETSSSLQEAEERSVPIGIASPADVAEAARRTAGRKSRSRATRTLPFFAVRLRPLCDR